MNNNIPKVSILVPVYGVERYIAECARSLFGQTYRDIEYVFVDDCSPDRSIAVLKEVLNEFPDRKEQVRVIRQDRNRGLGAARKRAVEECNGQYIMHVDSDDRITPDAVERLVEAAVTSDADIVDGAYCELYTGKEPDFTKAVQPSHLPKEQYLKRMLLQNIVSNNIWGRLYKHSLYTDNGINSVEGIDYGEDFGIVPRLLLHASRIYINNVVYLYRNDNAGSYTHKRTPKQDRSLINANATVYRHFLAKDISGTYTAHLNMGMVNLYRYAAKNKLPQTVIDEALGTPLKGFAPRLCRALFGSCLPYSLSDIVYRIFRKMYV